MNKRKGVPLFDAAATRALIEEMAAAEKVVEAATTWRLMEMTFGPAETETLTSLKLQVLREEIDAYTRLTDSPGED